MTLFLINRHCHTGLASLCISSQSVDELRWTRSQPLSFAPPAGLADLQPEAQPRKKHELGAPARWEHPTPSSFPWGFITKQPTIPTLEPRQLTTSTQAQISVLAAKLLLFWKLEGLLGSYGKRCRLGTLPAHWRTGRGKGEGGDVKIFLTSLKSWMLQMKYGVFGRRLSIYTQSLKNKILK